MAELEASASSTAEAHGMSRMQELLSSYYGMQDRESEQETLRNIDAKGFDAGTYVKEMLQTRGLNDLLSRDDQLIGEIKELDTSMQMLVYENYNKFISATDTIRKMRTNVASMEDEVAKVVRSMDVITDKSESINVALAPHRSKVEKLIGVRRLLKRLEFIFELPQRLNTALKQEEYANATQYYLLARQILGRYEHIASFKTIQVEAERIVQQLQQMLSKRLTNPALASSEICETVTLLTQLDACSDDMRQQFLDWHQTYFEKRLTVFTVQAQTPTDSADPETVLAFLQRLNCDVLTPLRTVFRVYKTNFLPELVAKEARGQLRASSALPDDAFVTFARELFALYLRACAAQFRRPHQEFGSEDEIYAFQSTSEASEASLFDAVTSSGAAVSGEYVVLMSVLKYFMAHVKDVDAVVPPCRLIGGAVDVVGACVRFQIERVFRRLRLDTAELLVAAHSQVHHLRESSRSLSQGTTSAGMRILPVAQDAARSFTALMQQVLRQMEPLAQTGASILREMSRLFSDLVQSQFYHFLKWFNASMVTYTEGKRAFAALTGTEAEQEDAQLPWLEPTPAFVLFLAFLCEELAADGIVACIQLLVECLPTTASSGVQSPLQSPHQASNTASLDSSRTNSGTVRATKPLDVAHMVQVTHETSVELIQHVAKYYGNQLVALVRKGVEATAWLDLDDEPRSVQEMAAAVVEAALRNGRELALALGDEQSTYVVHTGSGATGASRSFGSRDFRRRTSGLKSREPAAPGASGGGMQLDVERIFAKQVQVFPSTLPGGSCALLTAEWFVQSMLQMAAKALGELVRTQELSKFGLQQVQVNAEFLRATTAQLVLAASGQEEIERLLSDVLSIARERAVEDVLMEQSSVVAIVSTKSTQVLSRRG